MPEGLASVLAATLTTPAEKEFELVVEGDEPTGWAINRCARIASLYPWNSGLVDGRVEGPDSPPPICNDLRIRSKGVCPMAPVPVVPRWSCRPGTVL